MIHDIFVAFNTNWGHQITRARPISSVCGSGTQTTEGTLGNSHRLDRFRASDLGGLNLQKQGRIWWATIWWINALSLEWVPISKLWTIKKYFVVGRYQQINQYHRDFEYWRILAAGLILFWILLSFLSLLPFYFHRISNCPPRTIIQRTERVRERRYQVSASESGFGDVCDIFWVSFFVLFIFSHFSPNISHNKVLPSQVWTSARMSTLGWSLVTTPTMGSARRAPLTPPCHWKRTFSRKSRNMIMMQSPSRCKSGPESNS